MEEAKSRRGRPRIDAHLTEELGLGRRQTVNKLYMYEGMYLITEAASEIQNPQVLWEENREVRTVKSRDGILEQLGRMELQDHLSRADQIYLANLAIAAVDAGYTTREVEIALRVIRKTAKSSLANPESKMLRTKLDNAVDILRRMGGVAW